MAVWAEMSPYLHPAESSSRIEFPVAVAAKLCPLGNPNTCHLPHSSDSGDRKIKSSQVLSWRNSISQIFPVHTGQPAVIKVFEVKGSVQKEARKEVRQHSKDVQHMEQVQECRTQKVGCTFLGQSNTPRRNDGKELKHAKEPKELESLEGVVADHTPLGGGGYHGEEKGDDREEVHQKDKGKDVVLGHDPRIHDQLDPIPVPYNEPGPKLQVHVNDEEYTKGGIQPFQPAGQGQVVRESQGDRQQEGHIDQYGEEHHKGPQEADDGHGIQGSGDQRHFRHLSAATGHASAHVSLVCFFFDGRIHVRFVHFHQRSTVVLWYLAASSFTLAAQESTGRTGSVVIDPVPHGRIGSEDVLFGDHDHPLLQEDGYQCELGLLHPLGGGVRLLERRVQPMEQPSPPGPGCICFYFRCTRGRLPTFLFFFILFFICIFESPERGPCARAHRSFPFHLAARPTGSITHVSMAACLVVRSFDHGLLYVLGWIFSMVPRPTGSLVRDLCRVSIRVFVLIGRGLCHPLVFLCIHHVGVGWDPSGGSQPHDGGGCCVRAGVGTSIQPDTSLCEVFPPPNSDWGGPSQLPD
eukprot:scaffold684_cov345-Pavlova_lutheri.AAC.18